MKNTTLSENASNRASPQEDSGPRIRTLRRVRVLLGATFIGVVVAFALSFIGGSFTPGAFFAALSGEDPTDLIGRWWELRASRLLFAAAAGGALSVAGVAFQAVLRNPLAEPYILGISGGASVGVLTSPWWWIGGASLAVPAFAGALFALGLLIGAVKWARVRDSGTLILTGAVLNSIFGAVILLCYVLLSGPSAGGSRVERGLLWVMGDLGPTQYLGRSVIPFLWLVLVLGLGTLLFVARGLDLLALGDEEAADLGVHPASLRWCALLTASLITAAVVAAAGPIGFVGLIVPHTVRRWCGVSHRRVLPLAAIAGAVFLMVADTIARVSLGSSTLPVGVVTALLGGPFFLLLLRQRGGEIA